MVGVNFLVGGRCNPPLALIRHFPERHSELTEGGDRTAYLIPLLTRQGTSITI